MGGEDGEAEAAGKIREGGGDAAAGAATSGVASGGARHTKPEAQARETQKAMDGRRAALIRMVKTSGRTFFRAEAC
jgi:hypothetical protein